VNNASDRNLVAASQSDSRPSCRAHARPQDYLDDLNQLRIWIDSKPDVPEGAWYKDFGSFKICGEGTYPKTFLLAGQPAKGRKL